MVKSALELNFFGAPLFLCLISLPGTVSQEGCFEGRELTCDPPTPEFEGVDAQEVCNKLEVEYLGLDFLNLTAHADLLNAIPTDSERCNETRKVYHQCYWCDQNSWCFDPPEDACAPPQVIDETVETEATCDEVLSLVEKGTWIATTDLCYRFGQSFYTCDFTCGDGYFYDDEYLGADTEAKKKALVWMSRVSAILSFFGSSYILWDVLHSSENRAKVYHQLLFGIACFDMCTAVAWAFSTAPIPKDGYYYTFSIYGAEGNDATCTAQGFFLQLGVTSVFYNVTLSAYYFMVIVKNSTERRLKRARWILHGVPLIFGFGFAFGLLPLYSGIYTPFGCYGEGIYMLVFGVAPIGVSIVAIAILLLIVYLKVRRQVRASQRWRLGNGASTLERKVFWQCLSYVLAFCITWPILFVGYIYGFNNFDEGQYVDYPYGLAMTVSFVAPLQGFNNFLVYVRPRWETYRENRKRLLAAPGQSSRFRFFWRRRSESAETEFPAAIAISNSHSRTRSVDPSVLIVERNENHESPEDDTLEEQSVENDVAEEARSTEQQAEHGELSMINEDEEKKDELSEKSKIES